MMTLKILILSFRLKGTTDLALAQSGNFQITKKIEKILDLVWLAGLDQLMNELVESSADSTLVHSFLTESQRKNFRAFLQHPDRVQACQSYLERYQADPYEMLRKLKFSNLNYVKLHRKVGFPRAFDELNVRHQQFVILFLIVVPLRWGFDILRENLADSNRIYELEAVGMDRVHLHDLPQLIERRRLSSLDFKRLESTARHLARLSPQI